MQCKQTKNYKNYKYSSLSIIIILCYDNKYCLPLRRTRNDNDIFFVALCKNCYLKSLFSTYVVHVFTKLTFEKSH